MAQIKVTKVEVENAKQRIMAVVARISQGTNRGLREWGEETMLLAKERCPVDTGALRSTGKSTVNSSAMLELSFGGPAVNYAFTVHEGIRDGRPINFRSGQSKFLESAIDERESKLRDAVKDSISREVGR